MTQIVNHAPCPACGQPVVALTPEQVVAMVKSTLEQVLQPARKELP
jgi:hypothetical protein